MVFLNAWCQHSKPPFPRKIMNTDLAINEVPDAPSNIEPIALETPFFAVSILKFSILSMCTLGFYGIYWFYRNWKLIEPRAPYNISPVWRSIFGIFFCYSCFSHMARHGEALGYKPTFAPGSLAIAWTIAILFAYLPNVFLLSFFAFLFIIPVQSYANHVNQFVAPQHDCNTGFNGWNWIGIVMGGGVLILGVIGLFLD